MAKAGKLHESLIEYDYIYVQKPLRREDARKSLTSLVYIFHGRHWRLWQEPVQVVAHSAPVSSQHLQTTPSVEKILEYSANCMVKVSKRKINRSIKNHHWERALSVNSYIYLLCFWDKSVLASDVICFWDAETVTISNSRSRVEEGLGIPMLDPSVFNETWASVIISSRQKDNTGKWSCKRHHLSHLI